MGEGEEENHLCIYGSDESDQAKGVTCAPAHASVLRAFCLFTAFTLFILCASVHGGVGLKSATVGVWRSEDNIQESVFSFHLLGPKDQTHVFGLSGEYLFPPKTCH